MLSDVSGQQETTLYFAGVAAVCSFNAVALFLAVRESTTAEACTEYENRYRGFKWVRSVGYAALVVLQLSLFAARLASHWLDVSWIDAAQSLVLLLYVMTLVSRRPCKANAMPLAAPPCPSITALQVRPVAVINCSGDLCTHEQFAILSVRLGSCVPEHWPSNHLSRPQTHLTACLTLYACRLCCVSSGLGSCP